MKNVPYRKGWGRGALQMHMDPPQFLLIPSNKHEKSDKDCVEIKLGRDPTLENLDLYEFKMALFDNKNRRISCCLYKTTKLSSRRQ